MHTFQTFALDPKMHREREFSRDRNGQIWRCKPFLSTQYTRFGHICMWFSILTHKFIATVVTATTNNKNLCDSLMTLWRLYRSFWPSAEPQSVCPCYPDITVVILFLFSFLILLISVRFYVNESNNDTVYEVWHKILLQGCYDTNRSIVNRRHWSTVEWD